MGTGIGITGPCSGGGSAPSSGWVRNPDWQTMPVIVSSDEKFAGLLAIYENDFNEITISIGGNGGTTLYWGDGTSQVTANLVGYTKLYDYATTAGPISVDSYGRNYKQVMVEIDFVGSVITLYLDRLNNNVKSPMYWLDLTLCKSDITTFGFNGLRNSTLLQRLTLIDNNITSTNSVYQYLRSLRVLDFSSFGPASAFQSTFLSVGDIRDNNNNPINLNVSSASQLNSCFQYSEITKFGNIDAISATQLSATYQYSSIREIGYINVPSATSLPGTFNGCASLHTVGNITTSSSLTNIANTFIYCVMLDAINISDCSGITSTSNTFLYNYSLTSCILTGLTVGITVKDNKMDATALDALMTSLGTASGAQTLDISGCVGSATCDTSIATTKGWTVVI